MLRHIYLQSLFLFLFNTLYCIEITGIIQSDTLYADTSVVYEISGKVQVAENATLTFGPGTTLSGGHIEVFGVLSVAGTLENPVTVTDSYFSTQINESEIGYLDITHSVLINTKVGAHNGGAFSLTYSTIRDSNQIISWEAPDRDIVIRYNIFQNAQWNGDESVLYGSNHGGASVYIQNNLFDNCGSIFPAYSGTGSDDCFISGNTFMNPKGFVIEAPESWLGGGLYSISNNYWGTTLVEDIPSLIYDSNDDLNLKGPIVYQPVLIEAASSTPVLAQSYLNDTDGDGLYDYHETGTGIYVSKQNTGTDPNNIDSDGDGITDGIEVNQYNTNPNLADTNSDQINDNISLENNIDPNGDYSNLITFLSTNPESLNLFTQAQYSSAEANARTQGREDVISSPNDYSLHPQAAYDAIVAERDARPTQAAYDAMVAERDARPTQAAYDAMVAERDSRPTQDNYDSLSQELVTLNNRVYDVLPKLTPARPIFDYPTINQYFSEAKQEIDNSREYSLTYKQIEDDILSLDGYIMVLENGINQSDLENANGLLENIISNIESSDLSVKVSYDFTIAKAKFELAKIYLSIGDLNSTYYRVEEGKQEIENSRSFDTTYQSIDSEIAIFENALLQEDLDAAHDALEDIIYDLEYSEFASNVQYDFSIAESKFRLIYDEISSYWQVLDNYDPTPVPSETLENYIIGLNQEIEDSQALIDQKIYIQEVKDLRPGSAMIEVSGSQATVQLQMEESSDLQTWEDTGTPATMTIPADTDTKFFRFKMAE